MAGKGEKKFDSTTCLDIIGFQDYLKRLRTVDDTIILNLNSTVTTSSTAKETEKNTSNCLLFRNQLNEAYNDRDQVIDVCLAEARAKVSQLKELKAQNESDLNVQKELKRHQTRLRMIEKELTVEQIIRDRSLKALQERCRRFVNL